MNMTQVSIITAVLLLSLHAAPAWSSKDRRCYYEKDLSEAAEKKLSSYYLQSHNLPARGAVASDSTASFTCPVELYQQQKNLNISMRSVSPWTYVIKNMEDHYPSAYAEAKCLCTGCIMMEKGQLPVENHDYASFPLMQSRLFLKRELCSGGEKYHLKPVTINVAVGCVCLKSRSKEQPAGSSRQ